MPIELIVWMHDDATEEDQKHVAAAICFSPAVIGVYRKVPAVIPATHPAPGATQ